MVVQHNLSALNTNRQFGIVNTQQSQNTEKLSSGYKINRAADDAAGLSISEKMRKQIRGLTQASANAEDGISCVQTAEGALEEVHDMLQRMNELCVQAANGTNAETEKQYIQNEIDQLNTEIDRVATSTKFNEIYLLDGSIGRTGLSAGSHSGTNPFYTILNGRDAGMVISYEEISKMQDIKILYHDIVAPAIDVNPLPPNTLNPDLTNTDPIYNDVKEILKKSIVPQAVSSIISAYSPAFDYLQGSNIEIGLRLADPLTDSNLSQSTLAYVAAGTASYGAQGVKTYTLCVNTNTLNGGNMTSAIRNELEVTIVHEMIHAFMDESMANGMFGTNSSGASVAGAKFPSWFKEGMAQTAAGGYYNQNDWVNLGLGITGATTVDQIKTVLSGNYKLQNCDSNDATIQGRSRYGTGYLATMYLGYLAGGKSLSTSALRKGMGLISGDLVAGTSLTQIIKNLTGYSTISDFEANFPNDAAGFVKSLTDAVGNGTGGLIASSLTTSDDILSDANLTGISLFALNTTYDTAANAYNVPIYNGGSAIQNGTPSVQNAGGTGGTGTGRAGAGGVGNVVAANGKCGFSLHVGADSSEDNKIRVTIDAVDHVHLGLESVDVTTDELATKSIDLVSFAIQTVSQQRSNLGAIQNRLEHTIKNLDNVVENTTAAESQIRDTDMAKMMVEYSNKNVLLQAGQSMLVQANQSKQGILSLLG